MVRAANRKVEIADLLRRHFVDWMLGLLADWFSGTSGDERRKCILMFFFNGKGMKAARKPTPDVWSGTNRDGYLVLTPPELVLSKTPEVGF